MNLKNLPYKVIAFIIVIIVTATIVAAQQARGSLRGLITDELGAAIVGANVTLTDASGAQKKTTTNGEGVYTLQVWRPASIRLSLLHQVSRSQTLKN